MNKIKVGYEIGEGTEATIPLSHLIVTGVTSLSGKTTTLEALIQRSGLKAIVFKTKIGEKGFARYTEVPPFFRDRSDYDFVKSLIEAYSKEKLFIEKGTLMQLCKGSSNLLDIKKRLDEAITGGKLRGIKEEIHVRLQHYLEHLIPQIQYSNFSKTLNISEGINIMNLERFSEEAQSLIIQSVADEVLKTMNNTVLVIPEAWKFLPQKYNNPCKRIVESYIRQGATNKNFVWLDSQDMAGVDKIPLKQISTWILGYQSERNEVKHTLDQIALPKASKPKEEQIMSLKRGHFFISSYDGVSHVYVQPVWLDDELAQKVARGELQSEDVAHLENQLINHINPVTDRSLSSPSVDVTQGVKKELNSMRIDFFNKIQEIMEQIRQVYSRVYILEQKIDNVLTINEDELVAKVLQKMPLDKSSAPSVIDEEALIKRVIARVPKSIGSAVYEIAPLDMLKKNFLKEARDFVLAEASKLNDDQKKILKFVESQDRGCSQSLILDKCLFLSPTSGSNRSKCSKLTSEMAALQLVKKDKNAVCYPSLKDFIKSYLGTHEASTEEVSNVYNHILNEMLK